MSLEEQIAQITNPQEFVRLCNAIFTERYGNNFQVIDGNRSDEGNDGYVISEKRILAIYCPIKPERKRDADYLGKIRGDLNKTAALRDSGKFDIENWTFITPRKLSNDVIATMQREAKALRINATHQEATFLTNELHRNKHILRDFPGLQSSDIDGKLNEISNLLKELSIKKTTGARITTGVKLSDPEINENRVYKGKVVNAEEFDLVMELRKNPENEDAKPKLRSIFYASGDSAVRLNALLGLLDLHNPLEDSAEDLVHLCDEGIRIAEQVKSDSAKAYLLAQKGYFFSSMYSFLDMETAFQVKAGDLIGFPSITEHYRQKVLNKLRELEGHFTTSFDQAISIAKKHYDLQTLATILIFVGNAAGQRAQYLQSFDVNEQAASDKQTCRKALLSSKEIYDFLKDELGKANALHNLANQIRFWGEKKEALSLTDNVVDIAKKYGDKHLLMKAEMLKNSIVRGC